MYLRMDILGETQISRNLIGMGGRIADARPVWLEVMPYIAKRAEQQFDSRGSAFGTPWQPLKPATILAKQLAGYPNPEQPLVATGQLKKAMTQPGRTVGGIRQMNKDEMRFGSSLPKAKWMHGGVPNVPARPIIRLEEIDKRLVSKAFQLYAKRGIVRPL